MSGLGELFLLRLHRVSRGRLIIIFNHTLAAHPDSWFQTEFCPAVCMSYSSMQKLYSKSQSVITCIPVLTFNSGRPARPPASPSEQSARLEGPLAAKDPPSGVEKLPWGQLHSSCSGTAVSLSGCVSPHGHVIFSCIFCSLCVCCVLQLCAFIKISAGYL